MHPFSPEQRGGHVPAVDRFEPVIGLWVDRLDAAVPRLTGRYDQATGPQVPEITSQPMADKLAQGTCRFLTAGYVFAIVGGIGRLAVYHTYVMDCRDRCGFNMFGFWVSLPFAEFLSSTTDVCFAVLGVMVLVMLVQRFRAASIRARRTLWLPLGSAAGAVLLVAVSFAGNAMREGFAPPAVRLAATLLAVAAVPAAFLWGLLRERLAFAGVGDMVGELGRVGPDQTQPRLARVLADPGLRVLFPVGDDGCLMDVDGNHVDAPVPDPSTAVTRLGDGPTPLAVLVHDAGLLEHRDLLDAAGAAALLALENARLQAEVRAQLAEVRASRARLVDVADTERRRLERDLHDGAQQRLLGLGMTLQALRSGLPDDDPGTSLLIEEASAELRSAVADLRDLAQGIHPAVLTDQGLTAALGMLARRCPLPVNIQGELSHRPPDVGHSQNCHRADVLLLLRTNERHRTAPRGCRRQPGGELPHTCPTAHRSGPHRARRRRTSLDVMMTTGQPRERLATFPLGTRIVVRTAIPGGFTDTLGHLRDRDDLSCQIQTRRGLRRVALADVVAAKAVPEPPPRLPPRQ